MEGKGKPSVFRLLGLARRAGAVAPGTGATRQAIRSGEARLVLMAGDASSVQLDKVRSTLHDLPIPQVILGDRALLGAAIGMAPVSALAVTDASLAERVLRELASDEEDLG